MYESIRVLYEKYITKSFKILLSVVKFLYLSTVDHEINDKVLN